jgi:hypothetical protein
MLSTAPETRLRHEAKFVLPQYRVPAVRAWLDHCCARDPAYGENIISSVYFDTLQLDLLEQKEQSEYIKHKVRIRWYTELSGSALSDRAYLEVKGKQGARTHKRRIPLPVRVSALDRDPIGTAVSVDLAEHITDTARNDLRRLLPVCVVRYRRRRYIEMATGSRIALDHAIEGLHANPRFRLRRPAAASDAAVLEVKGPGAHALPPTLHALVRFGVRKTSFSKYAVCVRRLIEGE